MYVIYLTQIEELVRGNLTPLQRAMLGSLITIEVHARDVLERLIEEEVSRY